jgi:hypothetical protein
MSGLRLTHDQPIYHLLGKPVLSPFELPPTTAPQETVVFTYHHVPGLRGSYEVDFWAAYQGLEGLSPPSLIGRIIREWREQEVSRHDPN